MPLSVAFVSALTAYLEYQQVEQTIVKYNQTMTKLANLADEWVALLPEERKSPKRVVQLVEETEQILQSEHLGWVQQMQTAQAGSEKPGPSQGEGETGADHPARSDESAESLQQEQPDVSTIPGD